jgi:hypothetical protein
MRRYLAACVLASCLFVFLPACRAQSALPFPAPTPPTPASPVGPGLDAQSAAALASCKAALGAAVSAQIKDTIIQATISTPDDPNATTGTVTIESKGTDMVRWEGTNGGKSFVTIAAHGQLKHKAGSVWTSDASANAIHQRMTHLPALMIFQELARGDLSATLVAEETMNGHSVHHLTLVRVSNLGSPADAQLTKNSRMEVFIDSQTGLIAKIEYIHVSETDWRLGTPTEIFYDDYRAVNGMLIPFHQRTVINKTFTTDLNITSVQFNAGLADTEFKGN